MTTLLLVASVVALGLWLVSRCGCQHVDEQGRSVLVWMTRDGRICGWCPQCFAVTRGWGITPAPRPARRRLRGLVTALTRLAADGWRRPAASQKGRETAWH